MIEERLSHLHRGRFRIVRRVGAGGMGVVYEAEDSRRQARVALKTLLDDGPEGVWRLKNEFRRCQGILHKNLVQLYELFASDGTFFFTMEFVDGTDLLQYCRPNGTLDVGRMRAALPQLVDGVFALHGSGLLHRDIKPSNVLVDRGGRVVVLDFGLTTHIRGTTDATVSEKLAGTVAYMSPEQGAVGKEKLTAASDWYSVGVLLYQLLNGRLPFSGDIFQVIELKRTQEEIEFDAGVDPELRDICRGLLAREPSNRNDGARLRSYLLSSSNRTASLSDATPGAAASFAGRQRELERLDSLLKRSQGGESVICYIEGESGIGKTRLVRELRRRVNDGGSRDRDDSVVFLEGRCLERESVPYKAIDSLIDELSSFWKLLDPTEATYILPREPSVLKTAFPVLERVQAVARSPEVREIVDPQERRRRCFAALREIFQRLCARRSVILFLDDLQWVDGETVSLLRALMREPDAPALLLLMTARPTKSDTELGALRREWAERCATISLGPLAPGEAVQLVEVVSGARHADPRVIELADGSPFLLEELGRWLGEGNDPGLDVSALLEARLERLPPRQRRLLSAVALAGQPLCAELVAGLCAITPDDALRDLSVLTNARLARVAAGQDAGYEPYHDRIRDAASAALDADQRKALHLGLATRFEAGELDADGRIPHAACARHFRDAGENARALPHAIAAGRAATQELAFDLAAQWFGLALEDLPKGSPERARLAMDFADALSNGAQNLRAAQAYIMAADLAGDRLQSTELRCRAARELLSIGHLDRGVEVLREVLSALGLRYPKSITSAILQTMADRAALRLRGYDYRLRDAADVAPELLAKIDACCTVASTLGFVDPWPGIRFQAKHTLLALQAGEPYRLARAFALDVAILALMGRDHDLSPTAMACLDRAYTLAETAGSAHALGLACLGEAAGSFFRGRWARGAEKGDQAYDLFRNECTGVAWEAATVQLYMLVNRFFLGDIAWMAARMPHWIREADERQDPYRRSILFMGLPNFYWLCLDRAEEARERIVEAIEPWSKRVFYLQHYFALWAEGHVDLYQGKGERGLARWQSSWRTLERSGLKRVQLTHITCHDARARCALGAYAAGDTAALSLASKDARTIEKEDMPWGNALALMLRASVAAHGGALEEARMLLEKGIAACRRADMPLHQVCCELRLGKLRAADDARAAVEWLHQQGVLKPEKVADVILPWPRGDRSETP